MLHSAPRSTNIINKNFDVHFIHTLSTEHKIITYTYMYLNIMLTFYSQVFLVGHVAFSNPYNGAAFAPL